MLEVNLWTKEEDDILREYYTLPSKGILIAKLPHRKWDSIRVRAHGLHISFGRKKWTHEEEQLLMQMYASALQCDIVQILNRWPWKNIVDKANHLGLKRDSSFYRTGIKIAEYNRKERRKASNCWTDDEILYLKQNYKDASKEALISRLHRKWSAILSYARICGLKGRQGQRVKRPKKISQRKWFFWTENEDKILKENYGRIAPQDIKKMLLDRHSVNGIKQRAHDMSLPGYGWSTEEDSIVRQNYSKLDAYDLTVLLPRRSWIAIKDRAAQMGIRRPHKQYSTESFLKKILDKIYPDEESVDNIRPEWLINPKTGRSLELDRYYPNLHLAFEYNGEQHYRSTTAFGQKDDPIYLQKQQERDETKRQLCIDLGIRLIVIRCTRKITFDNVIKIIEESKKHV